MMDDDSIQAVQQRAMEDILSIPENSPDRIHRLNNFMLSAHDLFSQTNREEYLNAAIQLFEHASEMMPKNDPLWSGLLINAGGIWGTKFQHTRELSHVDESIRLSKEAAEATGVSQETLITAYTNIALSYQERLAITEDMVDIDEAIRMVRKALDLTQDDNPRRSDLLDTLSMRLGGRFTRTGQVQDLEDGIKAATTAIACSYADDPERPRRINTLASLLSHKFRSTGIKDHLDDSIRISRDALDLAPDGHRFHIPALGNLGIRLGYRFQRFGHLPDLKDALDLTFEAIRLCRNGPGHPGYVSFLSNIGYLLGIKFQRQERMEDLDDAIRATWEAVKLVQTSRQKTRDQFHYVPGMPIADLPGLLVNLGGLLMKRPEEILTKADIDEALTVARDAVDYIMNNDRHRLKHVAFNNLGRALYNKFSISHEKADIDLAIDTIREAIKHCPPGHPDRVSWISNLSVGLKKRHSITDAVSDLREMEECLMTTLHSEEASLSIRVDAGRELLSTPSILDNITKSYTAAKTATSLLSLSSALATRAEDKQYILSMAAGIVSNAAAIALHANEGPEAAIELLETGRGVIASSLQDLRIDLSFLQEQHPDLARSLADVQERMQFTAFDWRFDAPKTTLHTNVDFDQRQQATAEMASLLEKIRSKPEFEGFLLSATESQMREAAALGPIVIINVSIHRCDALIVEESRMRLLELPQLTSKDIHEHADNLQSPDTLIWLWDMIVHPILENLGLSGPPKNSWSRIWWIPTWPLVRFPLHAAGRHFEPGYKTCLDRVISSYNSSIKAIIHTRKQQTKNNSESDMVLVGMENTPKVGFLRHVANEIDTVHAICMSLNLHCQLPPTVQREVLGALKKCRVFHFAGHGGMDLTPLKGKLLLDDWESNPLTVGSLLDIDMRSSGPFLAYLSACGTGRVYGKRTADENMHMMSAFQLAGFRHVIATLWNVEDALSADMASEVYGFLGREGFDDSTVSASLHHATRSLRDVWVNKQGGIRQQNQRSPTPERDPVLGTRRTSLRMPSWAPYVHYGV